MKIRPDMITTDFFNRYPKDQGLVIDFADVAELLPEGAGDGYVKSTDWQLNTNFSYNIHGEEAQAVQTRRNIDAESHIVAQFDGEPQEDLPDFGASGMIVKRKGDMHLAFPQIFDFAISRVHTAAFDAFKLYGPDLFEQAEMLLIVQRTDIEPQEAHRQPFASWHNHRDNGQNMDMIYSFFNVLGTENRLRTHKGAFIEPVEFVVPNNCILRIGGEIEHRSQINTTEDDIRREWGALTINLDPSEAFRRQRNYLSTNSVMVDRDDPRFEDFKGSAAESLSSDTSVYAYETPETVIEDEGIEVTYVLD